MRPIGPPGDDDDAETVGSASLLHAKLALAVEKVCRLSEVKEREVDAGVKFSRNAVLSLTKLMESFTAALAKDLQAFAHHRKRQEINNDDVKLCARKSSEILKGLERYENENNLASKRKRKPASATVAEKENVNEALAVPESIVKRRKIDPDSNVSDGHLSDEILSQDGSEDGTSSVDAREKAANEYEQDEDDLF